MATGLSTRNGNIGMALPTAAVNKLNNPLPSKECSNCSGHSPFFIHQVRHLGILRRLCTACVLRLHPSSFCPACFTFYGGSPPHPSKRVNCSNCCSLTHSHCAGDTILTSYLCTPCKDSSFSFFPLKDNKIDKKLALALLCAAKIASSSMGKAVTVAWAEADRKVREAALARKRARESLEHLLVVTRKEKARKENEAKVEDLDVDNGDEDGDGDGDGDIDVDLVRHIEDSLVKADD
ncbi:hypothetical protein ERO13_D13G184200v2 [Gossypium hirsutum]|uniref:Phorbol-ester/DAG-type domain-containing protein n=6 Tax=Gossypium TaxID=3633 RepID=A0A0D2W818_GOSRA|nr:uncharacterized protein LOC105783157 [Gossypium raimondii]XP_016667932.1 uncharacterized protein LOC107888360 [Gossypium hirsutum]KAB1996132.1 hypothetical protein ES319_D13G210400v1 [Gossypium barbadense]TYG38432.1 hypothetical protein ES288_D13G222700v1 [Gossypium darwinii]TYH35871.1 hypothetical protein ES332_D13G224200v1 [Gossypium tomentosum]KAG4112786.1 hypothetical protein ERO13_D13G184200v2 [Gossypium hirsutum]KJB82690.1 hypothetical protein B456_013G209800 [Gossypium raimondii]